MARGLTDSVGDSLDRSAYVIAAHFPKLDAIPSVHADFGPYLSFDLNYAAIWAIVGELYYFALTGCHSKSCPVPVSMKITNE